MTEQPASVAREAKGLHQSLKELLKTKEPFDRDVDFQRKDLRRRYLKLLLLHTNTKESKDVENHLWMQTSYAFISAYKQRIAVLDRIIQDNQRNQQQQQKSDAPANPPPRSNNHGVVEHRKLVQRFRQFLADKQKFWTQLVLRLRRLFGLSKEQMALLKLGVNIEELNATPEAASATAHNRSKSRQQFPPENASNILIAKTDQEREAHLSILSKALICLGDIARYRELYSDGSGNRTQEDERRGRNRHGEMPPRPKNYEKAQACYEEARLLVPEEGNPSHQLAILASYKKDSFASLVHYYRALCATQKYETAAENLGIVLHKALESRRTRSRRGRDRQPANGAEPTVSVQIKPPTAVPTLDALKPFSALSFLDTEPKRENAFGLEAPNAWPRISSHARRTALGWSKRSNRPTTGRSSTSSTDQKENVASTGISMTPAETLRLNRPRPCGRLTPGGRTPATQTRAVCI